MAELFRGATQGEALLTDTMFIQRQKLLDKLEPHRVKDERLEGIIASINFPILQQVFDEERRQAVHATQDGEVAPARFFTPNDIVLTNKEGYKAIGRTTTDQLMSYAGGPGVVVVNTESLALEEEFTPSLPAQLLFLRALIHEAGHATSSHYHQMTGKETSRYQVGVHQIDMFHSKERARQVPMFELLNEAINEYRTIQLTKAYVKASPIEGVTHADLDKLDNLYAYKSTSLEYFMAYHLVDQMVVKIAKDTGVSPDAVWESLVHAAINGLDFESRDAKMTLNLDELFGRGFTKGLTNLSQENLIPFIQKHAPDEYQKFMEALVRHVRHVDGVFKRLTAEGRLPAGE